MTDNYPFRRPEPDVVVCVNPHRPWNAEARAMQASTTPQPLNLPSADQAFLVEAE